MRHPFADYSDPGVYFLTLCTHNRRPIFGKIVDHTIVLNQFGRIVWKVWQTLPDRYPQISIDAAIVMPDHFHGIVVIHEKVVEILTPSASLDNSNRNMRRKMTIPLIVGYLKMNSAKQINLLRNSQGAPVWQRNYYDQIIRDDRNCDTISEYIITNPERWGMDADD
jgi:putative transposase